MLNSVDIKNVKFSKARSGYNQEEVDVLLDKIETDYAHLERAAKDFQNKIDGLNKEIEGYKNSQNSLQNILLNAQKLADQIVDDAKIKSAEMIKEAEERVAIITKEEEDLSQEFEVKANERKSELESELSQTIAVAEKRASSVTTAADDSVKRQQVLFDKIKLEIAAFRADITQKYKEHLELLQKIPDTVPMDPKRISEAVSAVIDRVPEAETFVDGGIDDGDEVLSDEIIGEDGGFTVNAEAETEAEELAEAVQ